MSSSSISTLRVKKSHQKPLRATEKPLRATSRKKRAIGQGLDTSVVLSTDTSACPPHSCRQFCEWVTACRWQVVVKRNDWKHITLASSVLRQHLMTMRALGSATFHTVTGTAPLLGSLVLRALRDGSLEAHVRDCCCAAKVGTPPDGQTLGSASIPARQLGSRLVARWVSSASVWSNESVRFRNDPADFFADG